MALRSDYKSRWYLSPNLISGSSEALRNETGLIWGHGSHWVGDTATVDEDKLIFGTYAEDWLGRNYNLSFAELVTGWGVEMAETGLWLAFSTLSKKAEVILLNVDTAQSASATSIVPNYTINGRIYGNNAGVFDDAEWETYIKEVIDGTTYETFEFTCNFPYSELEYNIFQELNINSGQQVVRITPKYNYYIPEYELTMGGTDERLIPNITQWRLCLGTGLMTFWNSGYSYSAIASIWNNDFINYFSQNGADVAEPKEADQYISSLYLPLSQYNTSLLPDPIPGGDISHQQSADMYLDIRTAPQAYFRDFNPSNLTSETANNVISTGRNILFDQPIVRTMLSDNETSVDTQMEHTLPFYNKIEIPVPAGEARYRTRFADSSFSSTLLKMLKEQFLDQRGETPTAEFTTYSTFLTSSVGQSMSGESFMGGDTPPGGQTFPPGLVDTYSVVDENIRSADFIEMLAREYNQYIEADASAPDDFVVAGSSLLEWPYGPGHGYNPNAHNIQAQINPTATGNHFAGVPVSKLLSDNQSAWRFLHTKLVTTILDNALEDLAVSMDTKSADGVPNARQAGGIYQLFEDSEQENYHETIAYRIEKIGGEPTGDSRTENVLQNFWLANPAEAAEIYINYYDSQIKYGQSYTYNIYAYKLVLGAKYRVDDAVTTRRIGTTEINGTEYNCLEFFDSAGNTAEQLYDTESNLANAGNSFATNAQIYDIHKYLADFKLHLEPAIKIYEVPIATKTVTMLDHPANELDVIPFQKLDDSQEIGFMVNYEEFRGTSPELAGGVPFPAVITNEDQSYAAAYKESNSLTSNGNVLRESLSSQTRIQVFKMEEKPTSYRDFADKLYRTVDLSIPNSKAYLSNEIIYDKVATNKKYYYIFRFLNAHDIAGPSSPIIEAELVDDGGYKYAIFKDLFEQDLTESTYSNPITNLKKLLQIIPNSQHTFIDTAGVDFSDTARSQISNISLGVPSISESIWGKTFKIRLTSKKTGKKIDLNLTYNLTEDA